MAAAAVVALVVVAAAVVVTKASFIIGTGELLAEQEGCLALVEALLVCYLQSLRHEIVGVARDRFRRLIVASQQLTFTQKFIKE